MNLTEARNGINTILECGLNNIERKKYDYMPEYQKLQLCAIPLEDDGIPFLDSRKVIKGIYVVSPKSKLNVHSDEHFTLTDITSKNWGIFLVEKSLEIYFYYNLKYHYFGKNYKQIWKK